MNTSFLLSLAASAVPILAFGFVAVLLLYKLYVKIRSKFNVTVNCWFCNQNSRVPYLEANSWNCPHCEQYNGFTKDGDYNREIFQQLDCSNSSCNSSVIKGTSEAILGVPRNGFCNVCNEAQRLKVEKLAQFEPKNESRFDEELKAYKNELEEQYRLCATCDRHLNKVLREKKKMVLGSKFLDFIIKGAETLKQPHFNQIRHAQQQEWKWRLALLISLLTVLHICCLISLMPTLQREHLTTLFGESVGHQLFMCCSHIVAFRRVFGTYLELVSNNATLAKISLFVRTLFMMMLYTLGLKMPQIARISFASVYVLFYPFALLGLTFGYNCVDGFRLTRFTFLLALWSAFAGGLVEEPFALSQNMLMFCASLLTLALSASSKVDASPKLHDTTGTSFHKIYSEDYLSDDDSISLLSQQLNYSNASSSHSTSAGASFPLTRTAPQRARLTKSPITSSTLSLHQLPRAPISPNSSFKTCLDTQSTRTFRPQYANSMYNFAVGSPNTSLPARSSVFASNLEFSCRERPHSVLFGFRDELPHTNTLHNNSYSQWINSKPLLCDGMTNGFGFTEANNAASLHSPFSLSTSAVYPQRCSNSTNLLSPSRLGTTCPTSNGFGNSWLYSNQHKSNLEHRQGMTTIDENLSRASSQSSGFESQNGRLNVSRENSFCPESSDFVQHNKSLDASQHTFQPIETNARAFTSRSSLLSNSAFSQPLSVNCNLNSPVNRTQSLWKAPMRRKNLVGHDSFNLRKIHEELPHIKPGDLLKKWKENQVVA